MNPYNRITILWNIFRLKKLNDFRVLVVEWYNSINRDYLWNAVETESSQEPRRQINLRIREIQLIVASSYVSDSIFYSPPAATWGIQWNINLLPNIFNLQRFRISIQDVIDILDKSIWVYELEKNKSIIRTINPFFYISLLFDWLLDLPIRLLRKVWFWKTKNLESIWIVRVCKIAWTLLLWTLSVLVAIQQLWYWSPIKHWWKVGLDFIRSIFN